jgi:hypothetical protein
MQTNFFLRLLTALALLVVCGPSKSAEVDQPRKHNTHVTFADTIEIRGKIEPGDLAKVQRVAADVLIESQTSLPFFHINTPGGDLNEAMKIGRFFRNVLARVESYGNIIVAPGSEEERLFVGRDPNYVTLPASIPLRDEDIVRNYSAGVLMFFGGVERSHMDNNDQRQGSYKDRRQSSYKQVSIPVMGIHRPYFSKELFATLSPSQAQEAYKLLETSVRSYMLDMGAPQSLVDRMFLKASNEIELIPSNEFRKLYKEKESFFEEWLIAKCGVSSKPYALSAKEYADFVKIEASQDRSRAQDPSFPKKSNFYPVPGFPSSYVESLFLKVQLYHYHINDCKSDAVFNHQLEWAKSVRN